MTDAESEVTWEVHKELNTWDEARRSNATLDELMDGKVRYLRIIHRGLGRKAYEDALGEFVDDMYAKNMKGLTKLGANFLAKVSKRILRNKIITSFWVNLQHLVNLKCLKRMEFTPERVDIAIQKCTAKRSFKLGVKNCGVTKHFSDDDFCVYLCYPLFNRLLGVAKAQSSITYQKRGCKHIVEFIE